MSEPTEPTPDGADGADGTDGTDEVDELFDAEDDEAAELTVAPRPRRLMAFFGLALAGFVFIAIAGAVLLAVLILRVRDHTDPNHTVRQKYEARYNHCVMQGGDKYGCGITVLDACEHDRWWKNPDRTDQREYVCTATVPGVSD